MIARGECGTTKTAPDPLLDWVHHGVRDQGTYGSLPEEPSSDRQVFFRWMSEYTAYFAVNRGGCFALLDNKTGKVVAGAYCGPPRTVPFSKSFEEMGINIRKAGMAYGPTVLLNPRMKTLGIWMD